MDDRLLTTAQAANALAISPRTLESWRLKGIGPPFVSYGSRCVRYLDSELREWLTRQSSVRRRPRGKEHRQ